MLKISQIKLGQGQKDTRLLGAGKCLLQRNGSALKALLFDSWWGRDEFWIGTNKRLLLFYLYKRNRKHEIKLGSFFFTHFYYI